MGYTTRMDFVEIAIKPECIQQVNDAIAGKDPSARHIRGFLECLEIDPDGYLQWDDMKGPTGPYGSHRGDDEFAAWLSPFCTGGIIVFWSMEGDGGGGWGYEFDGEGGVADCLPRRAAAIKGWAGRRNSKRALARLDRSLARVEIGADLARAALKKELDAIDARRTTRNPPKDSR